MKDPALTETRLLIERIQNGNVEAFEKLIEDHKRLVFHIVYRMVINQADCEDICQDVFLKIHQNLSGFRFESKLSTWIAKIAYHTSLNHLKRNKMILWGDLDKSSVQYISGDCNRPDRLAEKVDTERRLQIEIEKMPLHYRTVLTLFHLEEMSYAEIAQTMSMPEGTVKSYLFRGRKWLKNRLIASELAP